VVGVAAASDPPVVRSCHKVRMGAGPFACPDWIWFVATGWLQVGNTGFQQSFADVLHIRLLGIVQGGDK
jgi:hypothetical protein